MCKAGTAYVAINKAWLFLLVYDPAANDDDAVCVAAARRLNCLSGVV
ncbi:Hypothetical protein, conserved [Brucella suis ATCC 23445]|uniref:Uncharacterized protein n=1 Tax=Brucella suis (strain ATCC 23445 / NCTC 10510) TaxID=470137 RepID=B0CKH6_BRUSI|nr:Hypothetical protein, conserved [Brucella suis ATCC 23445]